MPMRVPVPPTLAANATANIIMLLETEYGKKSRNLRAWPLRNELFWTSIIKMWKLCSRGGGGKALVAGPLKTDRYFFAVSLTIPALGNTLISSSIFVYVATSPAPATGSPAPLTCKCGVKKSQRIVGGEDATVII